MDGCGTAGRAGRAGHPLFAGLIPVFFRSHATDTDPSITPDG